MNNEFVVKLATEYLRRNVAGNQAASLVAMVREIDYIQHAVPRFEEVNLALKACRSVYVRRTLDDVAFVRDGRLRRITFEDMERAYVSYREQLEDAKAQERGRK